MTKEKGSYIYFNNRRRDSTYNLKSYEKADSFHNKPNSIKLLNDKIPK